MTTTLESSSLKSFPKANDTVLAEGKTKILQLTSDPQALLVTFKDDATAFNAVKHEVVSGKGRLNATITAHLFELLKAQGLLTGYLQKAEAENQLYFKPLQMIQLEVVVRNIALGSLVKRYALPEGQKLETPVIEFFYKSHDDPQITDGVAMELGLVRQVRDLNLIRRLTWQANEILSAYFEGLGIVCADFKLEFGYDAQGLVCIGDELSPDNFRLRDAKTGQVLDKDVFRLDLADLGQTYQTLLDRMLKGEVQPVKPVSKTYQAEVFVFSRKGIFSPESKAIQDGLNATGYPGISNLGAGRRFTFEIQANSFVEAERQVAIISDQLFANTVIEDYSYHLEPVKANFSEK